MDPALLLFLALACLGWYLSANSANLWRSRYQDCDKQLRKYKQLAELRRGKETTDD